MTLHTPISEQRLWLLHLARVAGDRHFDPKTGLCLIVRDTCWYATSLLFDDSAERRKLGNKLLQSLKSNDGTHTPASMLSLLYGIPDRLDKETQQALWSVVRSELINAAGTEWKDGNVNHPLGAYCTLVLGGELHNESWAVELGLRRLRRFQQRSGDHRSKTLRQAEMSEYNSLTYTALDLTFLALIAEHAKNSEARRLALFLEAALWVNVAMHYHAPSGQFAGPHSRSYFEDSFGGYSALHCALFAASGRKFFLDPELSVRFDHPSDLIQNALTAISPYHFPERAATIAWEKPFPYSFKMTTYGESYHENSRRADDTFAFDEEVYPGGWTDLTTFMTQEYALGSAATPYVNAGHADSVMLRIKRSAPIKSISDFRSAFTRGVYNGALPGIPNFCHTTSSQVDASYLTEEGRCATFQHENRLIVSYTPKRAGHKGIESFSTDFIFSYAAPFEMIMADGNPINSFPAELKADARICIRDGRTYVLLIPLGIVPAAGTSPLRLSVEKDFFVISAFNYKGPSRDFTRNDVNSWRSGFYLEVWTQDEFSDWADFLAYAGSVRIEETVEANFRSVIAKSKDSVMEFVHDPYREHIIARKWREVEESIPSLSVSAGGTSDGLFCPKTLYGSEGLKR
ncbi:MAG: hypothetical protein WEB37_11015 [Bacteroidota bacterium]